MEERIGHYRIVSELGRGGMGVVYKAHEESLNRFVALKVLGDHLSADPTAVQRFVREAQSAARLSHPNIVQIYAISEDRGRHYFAMEFVTGASLQQVLRERSRLPVAEAVRLVLQAAVGLAAAHDQGVVHRDIKPANLMLDERGLVKIADFGLALLAESASRLTATGMFMGTPGYLSPEQCLDADVDHRTDIYSLGITLYETLAGRSPFKADSPLALLKQILEVEPPDVTTLRPEVDDQLRTVLGRMIAKDRTVRYPDCHALVEDLEGWLRARNEPATGLAGVVASVRSVRRDGAATEARDLNTQPTVEAPSGGSDLDSGRTVATPAAGATPPPPPAPGGTPAAIPPPPVPPQASPSDPTSASGPGPGTPIAEPAPIHPAPAGSGRRTLLVVVAVLVVAGLGLAAALAVAWRSGLVGRVLGFRPAAVSTAAAIPPEGDPADTRNLPGDEARVEEEAGIGTPAEPTVSGGSAAPGDRVAGAPEPAAHPPSAVRSGGSASSSGTAGPATSDRRLAAGARDEPAPRAAAAAPQEPQPPPAGVAVVAVGEPLVAGEAAAAVERRLAAAGVELVDEFAVPGAARLVGGDPDPGQLCAALGGAAAVVVLIRAEVIAVRPLQYMGRWEDAYQSRLSVTAVDTSSCAQIAPPWSGRVEYTPVNVSQKAAEGVRPAARDLVDRLATR